MNCWPSGKYVHLLYMYSILGRGSFCFNYCLNSAWHGGDQFVALLRLYRSPGFFDSGLQLICIFWTLVSHFPLDNTFIIISSGLVSLLVSQAHQHHGHLTNLWCFWQCGQVPNPAGKWSQQKEAWSAPKCLGKREQWVGFQKTQWTNTSRWHLWYTQSMYTIVLFALFSFICIVLSLLIALFSNAVFMCKLATVTYIDLYGEKR